MGENGKGDCDDPTPGEETEEPPGEAVRIASRLRLDIHLPWLWFPCPKGVCSSEEGVEKAEDWYPSSESMRSLARERRGCFTRSGSRSLAEGEGNRAFLSKKAFPLSSTLRTLAFSVSIMVIDECKKLTNNRGPTKEITQTRKGLTEEHWVVSSSGNQEPLSTKRENETYQIRKV